MKKVIFPLSIRWRLPLSYAAIALLVTLALGLILLTSLRRHYHQQELGYLNNNAEAISKRLAPLFEEELPPEVLRSQVDSLAFLSQSRIRLLDDEKQLLADSGPSQQHEVAALSFEKEINIEHEQSPLAEVMTRTLTISNTQKDYTLKDYTFIAIRTIDKTALPEGSLEEPGKTLVKVLPEEEEIIETIQITQTGETGPDRLLIWRQEGVPEFPLFISHFPTVGTPYGFELGVGLVGSDQRSDQVVSQPFYRGNTLLGYVELSEGPAYGRQVLQSVAWSWAAAGLVAVLLAMLAGWGISRQISAPLLALTGVTAQMAGGDLSVRADVSHRDEFGMLAYRFNEMAAQVEETVVTLRRFVADAAHELHTPLTALRTNLELVEGNEASDAVRLLVNRATTQVARLETLTNDLLDLSRLETKSVDIEYTPVRLNDLLSQMGELYASQAEQKGLAFTLRLPDEPLSVYGNIPQLQRIIGNLLDNALKFTPKGGAVSAGLQAVAGTDWVELWVEDEGIGIPADELPQLFSRFHRGRNATHFPGSGLGLAIVKAIVEAHGGQVAAQNGEPGARFAIRLPKSSKGEGY